MTRKASPSGGAPYSAALISLSVPSTPTRNTLTRTPLPPGMSCTDGSGKSARWTESGLPGNTAMAFIVTSPFHDFGLRIADCGLKGIAREFQIRNPKSLIHDSFFLLNQLNGVTVRVAHQETVFETQSFFRQLDGARGNEVCFCCK